MEGGARPAVGDLFDEWTSGGIADRSLDSSLLRRIDKTNSYQRGAEVLVQLTDKQSLQPVLPLTGEVVCS